MIVDATGANGRQYCCAGARLPATLAVVQGYDMTSQLRFNEPLRKRLHLQLGHEDIQLCVVQMQYIHQHVAEPK